MRWLPVLAAGAAPWAVAAALYPARRGVDQAYVVALLALVVLAVSAFSGRRVVALVAAVGAAGAFDFFHTLPYLTFRISSREDVQTDLILLALGVFCGEVAYCIRRRRQALRVHRHQLGLLQRLSTLAASGESHDFVAMSVAAELVSLLELRDCQFHTDPNDDRLMPRVERDGRLRWGIYWWRTDQLGIPAKGAVLPIQSRGHDVGYLLLVPTPGHLVTVDQLLMAVAYADQVGAAAGVRGAAA